MAIHSESGSSPESPSGDFLDSADSVAQSSADEPVTSKSMFEAAFDRAEQARKEPGKHASGNSPSSEQAAISDSVSTSTSIDTDTPAIEANDGTSGSVSAQNDSTLADQQQSLSPPDSWPKDRREAFNALPESGKSTLLSIYRDMESGLKTSFNKLADERKALQTQFGFDSDQIKQLTDRARTFKSDPVAVISQLAEEAGIDVFFKKEDEQVPTFDSQEDLVKWLRGQSQREARQAAADEAKSLRQLQQQSAMKQKLDAEFAEAHRAHPDLSDHQEAILKYIGGFNLPVEMAYRLATYEGLTQLAQNGQTTLAELNKAKAELEKLQKLATMPPGRADGRSLKEKANGLDPYESAMRRAEQLLGR